MDEKIKSEKVKMERTKMKWSKREREREKPGFSWYKKC